METPFIDDRFHSPQVEKMGNTRAVSCYSQIAICLYLQATPNRQVVVDCKFTILLYYILLSCVMAVCQLFGELKPR